MPKEVGCGGEREHAARPASKNAKDKSNSAALLASRARAHDQQEANDRGSRCSSEKDSGYSDTGSDSLQMDAEEQRSVVSQPPGHILVSGTPELTPIFIIKNVVLKQLVQSGQEHLLQSPPPWGAGGSGTQAPTHVLLLQQPGATPTTAPPHALKPRQQPQGHESGASKKNKNLYLPILNSYPRIAPHPSKKTPEKPPTGRAPATEEHSLSKRVCMEEKREEVSTTTSNTALKSTPKQHFLKQPKNRSNSYSCSLSADCESMAVAQQYRSPRPPSSPPTSLSLGSPSVSSSETSPPPPSTCDPAAPCPQDRAGPHRRATEPSCVSGSGASHKPLSGSARHQRFLNTVEILSQSGLLDITLRTQELLRQSAATERDIAQLRQHTQLLCQATQAGANAPSAWEELHQVMAESGHYPNLKCLTMEDAECKDRSSTKQEMEADTSTRSDSIVYRYGQNGSEEVAPPSPLLALTPDLDCLVDQHGSSFVNDTFGHRGSARPPDEHLMPADSSTHGSLL
ncbi:CLOCK-interacting pacemaker isoform X2 [Chanos chanos]|nr:CLOCK-interacting pacemaker-like isoform X2 [Chanos chanos]